MTPFEKLVLRALALLVRAALWGNAFGTYSPWHDDAKAVIGDINEAVK